MAKEGQDKPLNRRGGGNDSVCSERRGDVSQGGRHVVRARSHRLERLRGSSFRSQLRRPAKRWAACFHREFPRERADASATEHCDAKRQPPKKRVPRSNSRAPHWW